MGHLQLTKDRRGGSAKGRGRASEGIPALPSFASRMLSLPGSGRVVGPSVAFGNGNSYVEIADIVVPTVVSPLVGSTVATRMLMFCPAIQPPNAVS